MNEEIDKCMGRWTGRQTDSWADIPGYRQMHGQTVAGALKRVTD